MSDASQVSFGYEVSRGVLLQLCMAVLGFVGTLLFARVLGPAGIGGFYLLLAAVQIFVQPVSGLATACKKRFSEASEVSREVVGIGYVAIVLNAFVAVIVGVVAHEALQSYTGLTDSPVLFVLLATTIGAFVLPQQLLTGTGRVSLTVWTDFLRSLGTLPLQIGFIFLGLGATGMAVGLAGATILAVPVSIYYLNTYPAMPTREVLRSVSMFAGYSIPKTLIGKTYRQIDLLLLGFLSTSAVAGYYGVAFKITIPVLMVSGVLSSGLMARVSNLHSKNRDVTDDVTNALSFASVLSVPIFIGSLVLASEVVVTAYGAEYADAAVFLIGIAFYRVFQTQSSQLDSSLNGLDRPDLSFRASGVGLGVNVLLGVGLTVWYGPIGIVVATIVAEAIQYVLLRRMVRNLLPDVDFFPDGLKQQVVGGVVMGIIVLIADFLVPPIPITGLRVLCLLAIGVLSYVAWLQRHGTPVSSLVRTLSNPA